MSSELGWLRPQAGGGGNELHRGIKGEQGWHHVQGREGSGDKEESGATREGAPPGPRLGHTLPMNMALDSYNDLGERNPDSHFPRQDVWKVAQADLRSRAGDSLSASPWALQGASCQSWSLRLKVCPIWFQSHIYLLKNYLSSRTSDPFSSRAIPVKINLQFNPFSKIILHL